MECALCRSRFGSSTQSTLATTAEVEEPYRLYPIGTPVRSYGPGHWLPLLDTLLKVTRRIFLTDQTPRRRAGLGAHRLAGAAFAFGPKPTAVRSIDPACPAALVCADASNPIVSCDFDVLCHQMRASKKGSSNKKHRSVRSGPASLAPVAAAPHQPAACDRGGTGVERTRAVCDGCVSLDGGRSGEEWGSRNGLPRVKTWRMFFRMLLRMQKGGGSSLRVLGGSSFGNGIGLGSFFEQDRSQG